MILLSNRILLSNHRVRRKPDFMFRWWRRLLMYHLRVGPAVLHGNAERNAGLNYCRGNLRWNQSPEYRSVPMIFLSNRVLLSNHRARRKPDFMFRWWRRLFIYCDVDGASLSKHPPPPAVFHFSVPSDYVTWVNTLWNQVTISTPPRTKSCASFEAQDCWGNNQKGSL
jgi:hypothetical protein